MAVTTLFISDNFGTLVDKFNTLSGVAGDLANLNTTATSDLVAAINSVYGLVDEVSDFRSKISVTDAGGDGSLSYNSTTGVITYTGPSASEVRAHFSAGEGIVLNNGQISVEDATSTNKGIASFTTEDFVVIDGAVYIKAFGITSGQIANDAVSRSKLKDEVELVIYNNAGTALKTLYGAGS
jgi:hypothetical protein